MFDLDAYRAATPPERLALLRELAAHGERPPAAADPPRGPKYDKAAIARAENPLVGSTYRGIITHCGTRYIELRHPDRSSSVHLKARIMRYDHGRIAPLAGDDVRLTYTGPYCLLEWCQPCRACGQPSPDLQPYCEICRTTCDWCSAPMSGYFHGAPCCNDCRTTLEPPSQRIQHAMRNQWGDHGCGLCGKTSGPLTYRILRTPTPLYVRVCAICHQEPDEFPLTRWQRTSKTQNALEHGLCEHCRVGRPTFFVRHRTDTPPGHYWCRYCVATMARHLEEALPIYVEFGLPLPVSEIAAC